MFQDLGSSQDVCFCMYFQGCIESLSKLDTIVPPSHAQSFPALKQLRRTAHRHSHLHAPSTPSHLELHLVWPVPLAQAERASEVFEQVGLALDVGQKCLVDLFLVFSARAGYLLLLRCTIRQQSMTSRGSSIQPFSCGTDLGFLPLLEECLLSSLLRILLPCKVSLLSDLLHRFRIDTFQLHLRRRSNNISSVDSS